VEEEPSQVPPQPAAPPPPPTGGGDQALQALIPYKNAPALIGYYLAVFSLVPCVGLFLGAAAVVLGIKGWQVGRENPQFHGKAHALVAMILGGLTFAGNAVLAIFIVAAILEGRRH
jgi:hypothetical protein